VQDFRKLIVWQKAHRLTLNVYEASKSFPPYEIYGLTAQLRRACFSIELNIAEGTGRGRPAQFNSFLEIASGSAGEVDCALELCRDLGFLDSARYPELAEGITEIRKMLWALIEKVNGSRP
jgi:four helix bundle protein